MLLWVAADEALTKRDEIKYVNERGVSQALCHLYLKTSTQRRIKKHDI